MPSSEAVVRRCSVKKLFLEISQNSQGNTCVRDSFLISCRQQRRRLLLKTASQRKKLFRTYSVMHSFLETLAKVFFSKFCKISKTTSSYRRLPVAASVICNLPAQLRFIQVNFLHVEYGI